MPIYAAVHLLFSPTAKPDATSSRRDRAKDLEVHETGLGVLPFTITLGYIIPAILMSLPIFSSQTHQYLVVVWQLFPVWVTALQSVFRKGYPFLIPLQESVHKRANIYTHSNGTVIFPLTVSIFTHITSLAVILWATLFSFFDPAFYENLSFSRVFIPPLKAHGQTQIEDMVQGALKFFQRDQYFGFMAALVWVLILGRNNSGDLWNIDALLRPSAWCLWILFWVMNFIAGPGAVLTLLTVDKDYHHTVIYDEWRPLRVQKEQ